MDSTTSQSQASGPRTAVSPTRRRNGIIAVIVIAVAFPLVLWQTWGYWGGGDDDIMENMRPDPQARGGGRAPGFAIAADLPPGGPGAMFDPAAVRQRVQGDLRAVMDASDEEWAKLQPKVEAVQAIQDQLRPRGGMMGPAAASRGASADAGVSASDLGEKTAALREAVEDKEAPAETVAATLTATRAARAKLTTELKAKQEELRKGLTPRQEAALITFGILE